MAEDRPSVGIVGTGYVGLVSGVAFALRGASVLCTDVQAGRLESIRKMRAPFFEPGLDEALERVIGEGRFGVADSLPHLMEASDVVFICVGTPSLGDGGIDLSYVELAAREIGPLLRGKPGKIVVVKSTVVPGTTREVVIPCLEQGAGVRAGSPEGFGVAMNPEFLREGVALDDALRPDRIVIGATDDRTRSVLHRLYEGFGAPIVDVDPTTAEMIKYASNALLATKISFANEMANLCRRWGIDVYRVMEGVGMDHRINPSFLRAGAGFGGSCFPKDVKALIAAAREAGVPVPLLRSVLEVNELQPREVVDLARTGCRGLAGRRVALLGLTFKPDTDDVRETRALIIYRTLLGEGASVVTYDPTGPERFSALLGTPVEHAASAEEALRGAHCAIIQSEWRVFAEIGPDTFVALMAEPVVVDGRRCLDPERMRAGGVRYYGIGLPDPAPG